MDGEGGVPRSEDRTELKTIIKRSPGRFPRTLVVDDGCQRTHLDFPLVPSYYSGHFLGCWLLLLAGGDLHWIWKPYELYQEVDYVYGTHALERGDGFTNAQSLLNIVENFMNIGYLYLAHIVESPVAPLLGFASAVMTLSKTVLYWAQEYYCGGCAVGHNDLKTLIVYWIIPNGLWLVVPSFIIVRLAKDIASSLRTADQVAKKDKLGKRL
ncbi:unnamed protein product [Somion occarium]|uniref:EXPERA domain-containing protein n=1 Tax=Somion occarium TaxID=3059160 RepID=A0ABP1DTJ6_9APHY